MVAPIYRCHTCWVDMRIIGRIQRLRCPRCHDVLAESPMEPTTHVG